LYNSSFLYISSGLKPLNYIEFIRVIPKDSS
jgi:hypothetical protein